MSSLPGRGWPFARGPHTQNVAGAVCQVPPYAVDVFSGVNSDGYIDAAKVRQFGARVALAAEVQTRGY